MTLFQKFLMFFGVKPKLTVAKITADFQEKVQHLNLLVDHKLDEAKQIEADVEEVKKAHEKFLSESAEAIAAADAEVAQALKVAAKIKALLE